DGQIDVAGVADGKPTEHRISVFAAAADLDVAEEDPVAEPQLVAQQIHLIVVIRSLHQPIHFLQEDDVRLVVSDGGDHTPRIVAAADAADALVDVVAQHAQPHPHTSDGAGRDDRAPRAR